MLIDVSHYQGAINWAQTDPAIDGAYVKVTEGTSTVDVRWQANHAAVVAGGRPVGGYHFADGADPVAEANHFADQYLTATWQLDPVLDAEVPSVTAAWVVAFRKQFRARLAAAGRGPRFRLYTSYGYLTGQLNPANWIDAQTTIWAARYASSLGWTHPQLVLWQNTSGATIPGVLGSVDEDQFMNGWTPAADQGGHVVLGTDDIDAVATAVAEKLLFNTGLIDPDGKTLDNVNVFLYWTNKYANLLPAIQSALAALATAVTGVDTDVKAAVTQLAAAVQSADADTKATIAAAVKGITAGTVDPAAFSAAVAPLLSAADVAAFKAQFNK